MGNSTEGKASNPKKEITLDSDSVNSRESIFSELVPRSALNRFAALAKKGSAPRIIFLDENKNPVSQLRREGFENASSQDVKKLQEEFYLQLEDPSQAGKKTVTVNLLALDAQHKERPLENLTLYEVSPGKFVSKAQLLIKKNETIFETMPDLFLHFNPVQKHEVDLGETLLVEYQKGKEKVEATAVCVPTAKLAATFPAVLNEEGYLISTAPKQTPATNLMTEVDPSKEKVAHRELQMQFDKSLAGKKVTWTITPLPLQEVGETSASNFKGDLKNSPNHKDYFEGAKNLGASQFKRLSQTTAETVIDANGLTSVRTNLPPIGFNKAQVKMQIEGIPAVQPAANFIVPAVVVIDPGHGGTSKDTLKTSSWNNAKSPSGMLEKDKTLEVGLALREELQALAKEKNLPIQVHMTRATDVNLSSGDRARLAKNTGADVFLSIHFNGGTNKTRGAEGYYRAASNKNVNLAEDIQLATSVTQAVEIASKQVDPNYQRQGGAGGIREDTKSLHKKLGVLSDEYQGNTAAHHPVKSALIEVDYLTNNDVDGLLKDKKLVKAWAKNMAGAIVGNLINPQQTEEKEESQSPKRKIR